MDRIFFFGRPLLAAALVVASLPESAAARELDVGVPDLELRFDNTFRYNVGVRTDPIDARIGSNPAFTTGEYRVSQGGLSASRLDLLSELDVAYRGRHGARLSGAAWYDYAYRSGTTPRSPAIATPGTYVGGDLSTYTLRRYRGPWGEVLDAFAFATVEAGSVPVTVKAGRHTVYWGESLMLAGAIHGVSYSQMPLDLAKGFATPGVEAKELFRPLGGVSAQAQVTPTLSLVAQFVFEWQSYVYPEGGTFLGPADFAFNGPDGVYRRMGPNDVFLKNGGASAPRDSGEWGLAARWRPEWLDGAAGVYYRRYADKLGAVLLTDNPGGVGPLSPAMPSPFQYRQYYGEHVDLFGLSLSRQIMGISVAAEVSYRRDTPLLAQMLAFAVPRPAPAPPLDPVLFPHGPPTLEGNTYQARGDTVHGLVNAIGVFSGGPAFPTASWALELTYSRWLEVRTNPDMFFGLGYGVCRGDPVLSATTPALAKGKADGCATRDHVAVGASFTPTWFRVSSGVDLLLPLNASWTIRGNSPVTLGGNEGSGTYAAGIAADVRNRYRLDLRYGDFFGRTRDDGTAVTSANGLLALLKNRGSVTLTAKATF
jgi:Protein of unknown function (DUF1302)